MNSKVIIFLAFFMWSVLTDTAYGVVIWILLLWYWLIRAAQGEVKDSRIRSTGKHPELSKFENKIFSDYKTVLDKQVKSDYVRREKALGHTDEQIDVFWRDFEKIKDPRVLKNIGSVRAKYVR